MYRNVQPPKIQCIETKARPNINLMYKCNPEINLTGDS